MKKKNIKIAIWVIVALAYLFSAQKMGEKRNKQFFIRFNTTDIKGKLEYVKIGYHGCVFKIEGIKKEFVFYPYTSELNENNIFDNIAKEGDSVIKEAYSDILRLKKESNKVYMYKFQSPND